MHAIAASVFESESLRRCYACLETLRADFAGTGRLLAETQIYSATLHPRQQDTVNCPLSAHRLDRRLKGCVLLLRLESTSRLHSLGTGAELLA